MRPALALARVCVAANMVMAATGNRACVDAGEDPQRARSPRDLAARLSTPKRPPPSPTGKAKRSRLSLQQQAVLERIYKKTIKPIVMKSGKWEAPGRRGEFYAELARQIGYPSTGRKDQSVKNKIRSLIRADVKALAEAGLI